MRTCEPGQLSEIDMTVQDGGGILKRDDATESLFNLTLQAMPFFSNLRKFKFGAYCDADQRGVCTNLLTQISTNAVNLRSVEIGQLEVRGDWLRNMRKLEELRITWKKNSSFDTLISCLKEMPKLKVFKLVHQVADVASVYNALAESCPNLETFSDEDRTLSSYQNYHNFDDSLTSRYAFLSKLSNLSYVTLTTYTLCGSDLYYPLVSLASKNIVKLTIVTSLTEPIVLDKKAKAEVMGRPLPQFGRLKSVKFDIATPNVRNVVSFDRKWTRCDLRCQFLFHFLRHVTSVQHFELAGSSLTHIDKIVEHMPTIRVLDLSETNSFEICKAVTNIVNIVLGSRPSDSGTFNIILEDEERVQLFKKRNHLEDNINFTFTTRNRWNK